MNELMAIVAPDRDAPNVRRELVSQDIMDALTYCVDITDGHPSRCTGMRLSMTSRTVTAECMGTWGRRAAGTTATTTTPIGPSSTRRMATRNGGPSCSLRGWSASRLLALLNDAERVRGTGHGHRSVVLLGRRLPQRRPLGVGADGPAVRAHDQRAGTRRRRVGAVDVRRKVLAMIAVRTLRGAVTPNAVDHVGYGSTDGAAAGHGLQSTRCHHRCGRRHGGARSWPCGRSRAVAVVSSSPRPRR